MKIRFTKAPTFTKAIIAAAVFAIIYLASASNLPSCSDTVAVLSGNGECIVRQSFLHTASGWLALIFLVAALVLLGLKHKDSIQGWLGSAHQADQGPSAPAPAPAQAPAPAPAPAQAWPQAQAPAREQAQAPVPTPVPGRASSFCAKCGTRIVAGDRFCQGCGAPMGSPVIRTEIPTDITDLR
jgi:zinc ribbon protein